MTYLLDTQAFLFWVSGSPKLGRAARIAMERGKSELLLSAVSSWEIAIKYALGKLKLPDAPERFVPAQLRAHRIHAIALDHAEALSVARLPAVHDDPFDRVLVAQAISRKVAVITADSRFEEYGVKVLW
jgi:PIN domain nuclease of toxin-antitoxin system